jgi:SAM-dependent methyltransferase
MLESLASLYVRGAEVDWRGFDAAAKRGKVTLPTYPFQRQRYWADVGAGPSALEPPVAFEFVAAAGRRQAGQAPLDLDLTGLPAQWRALDRLTTAYVLSAVRDLGAYLRAGEAHTPEELRERAGVLPLYGKVLARWLGALAGSGLLERAGEEYVARAPLPDPGLEDARREARERLADMPFVLGYVDGAGQRLVAVLTGRANPLESLFPAGSFAIAEGLYQNAPSARYLNAIARAVLEAAAAVAPRERELRVLEVGAGVGGMTSELVSVLLPGRARYHFTDLSSLFLLRAEERWGDRPFMRFGVLDIEKSPSEQGYPVNGFDVVVASNVLHATRDLHETLRNTLSLLAPGGVLVLGESTSHPAWFDLGLIEGWQRYDDDIRQGSPVLSAERWREALLGHGFEEVVTLPEAGSPAEILGQHLILARAPLAAVVDAGVAGLNGGSRRAAVTVRAASETAEELIRSLRDALPAEREDLLVTYVSGHVGRVLRLDPGTPPGRRHRLMDLGLDSLMAVELRNRLAAGLGLGPSLPATLMFDYPTIEAIARHLGERAPGREQPSPDPPGAESPGTARSARAVELAHLSEEEVERMLIEKLETA